MEQDKKQLAIFVVSTAVISIVADVLVGSISLNSTRKGLNFKYTGISGEQLAKVVLIGIVVGYIGNEIYTKISENLKPDHQKLAEAMLNEDLQKIKKGELKSKIPKQIIWG